MQLYLKLVPRLSDPLLPLIPAIVPEIMMSTKEVNEKSRMVAFNLILAMGRRMQQGGQMPMEGNPGEHVTANLTEYFKMILAGLAASTPHMISASIVTISRLLFEFKGTAVWLVCHASCVTWLFYVDHLPQPIVHEVIKAILLFAQSRCREVVKASLGFAKVIIVSVDEAVVEPNLKQLVRGPHCPIEHTSSNWINNRLKRYWRGQTTIATSSRSRCDIFLSD